MALLSRLFSTRKFNRNQSNLSAEKNERSSWKPFAFNKDQIRVLLFRECDWRGRKLLFDSQAVQKVVMEKACKLGFASRQKADKNKTDSFVEVTNGFGYQYTKPSADATLIGEMMFGAVAMTFRGTAMKVHSMANPNRLMCTKVFPSSEISHCKRRSSLEDSLGSSLNSMSGSEAESCARDVPQSSAGDSGFGCDLSLRSVSSVGSWTPLNSPASSRNSLGSVGQSGGSLSSLQRRWMRSMSTSLELAHGSNGDCAAAAAVGHRRTRLGLCVIVTLTEEQRRDMEAFIFEHISVVETMVERLRLSVERAYARKEMFVHVVHEGWQEMQRSFHDLLCLPRLATPMWICLGAGGQHCLAAGFLQDLCQLIATLDTKATNFFVSTLVTGVLTHHLGWVNSVWPPNSPPPHTAASSVSVMPQSLSDLSKSHPYNPLWAQLGDLHGALGSPGKTAKTVITSAGRKQDCVNKLLSIVSYFIRCGEVKEAVGLRYDADETSPAISRSFDLGSNLGTSSQTLLDVSLADCTSPQRCFSDESLGSAETNFVSPLLTVCLTPEKRKPEIVFCADDVQKRLNVTVDILNKEMERCKRERNGKGRNFWSAARAEWESEDVAGDSERRKEADCLERLKSDFDSIEGLRTFDRPSASVESEIDVEKRDGCHDDRCRQTSTPRSMKRSTSCRKHLGIYPNIEELATMENIGLNQRKTESNVDHISSDTIAEKVTALCRVPTSAVLFHRETFEPRLSRRLEAEKQTAAPDARNDLSLKPEVVFLVGDDVEVKGKRRSFFNSNLSGHENVAEPKVVTVRPSLIDLEAELGSFKTENIGKSSLSSFESGACHTEIFCDRCKTLLRERRNEGTVPCTRREFFSCKKCLYSKRDCEVVGLAASQRSRLEKVGTLESDVVGDLSLEASCSMFERSEDVGRRCGMDSEDAGVKDLGFGDLHLLELQVPSCQVPDHRYVGLAGSLLGGASPRYVPDLLLQGCVAPPLGWEAELRRDLQLGARSSALGADVTEAVCLVADTQTWEVHLVSSHTYVVDRPGNFGVRVGMSQLVANMLESVALLCRLKTPPHHCLSHLESKLRELLLRSHALAELLLSTEFCSMQLLTSSLDLDPNDVPLLLAVASTHTPHISQRYGLSFV